jgi:hypothetical protein
VVSGAVGSLKVISVEKISVEETFTDGDKNLFVTEPLQLCGVASRSEEGPLLSGVGHADRGSGAGSRVRSTGSNGCRSRVPIVAWE